MTITDYVTLMTFGVITNLALTTTVLFRLVLAPSRERKS